MMSKMLDWCRARWWRFWAPRVREVRGNLMVVASPWRRRVLVALAFVVGVLVGVGLPR